MVVLDRQLRVTTWTGAAAPVCGWGAAEALGRVVTSDFEMDFPDGDKDDFHQRLREGLPARAMLRLLRQDGGWAELDITADVLRSPAGEVDGYLCICRDVSRLKETVRALQEALDKATYLGGLVPICAWCKKIRNDTGYWQQIEDYLAHHADAHFTHGICPTAWITSRRNRHPPLQPGGLAIPRREPAQQAGGLSCSPCASAEPTGFDVHLRRIAFAMTRTFTFIMAAWSWRAWPSPPRTRERSPHRPPRPASCRPADSLPSGLATRCGTRSSRSGSAMAPPERSPPETRWDRGPMTRPVLAGPPVDLGLVPAPALRTEERQGHLVQPAAAALRGRPPGRDRLARLPAAPGRERTLPESRVRLPLVHKYDAYVYHHIDPNFGPDPDGDRKLMATETPEVPSTWKWTSADRLALRLLREAHRGACAWIFDGVFNHIGKTSPFFQDVVKNQQRSRFKDWFVIKSWDDPARGTRLCLRGLVRRARAAQLAAGREWHRGGPPRLHLRHHAALDGSQRPGTAPGRHRRLAPGRGLLREASLLEGLVAPRAFINPQAYMTAEVIDTPEANKPSSRATSSPR